MVTVEQDDRQHARYFVLRPNYGPKWRQTVAAFVLLALISLSLALALALAGYWPVLPLAGLELGLLGWALYVSARRSTEREVIWVRQAEVEVQKGRRRPERVWVFQRSWAEVYLLRSEHSWYPSRLWLRSQGQEVEVGGFLQEEERVFLARELRKIIGPMAAPGDGV